MLRRKIDSYLLNWKNNPDKKPLIVKGMRQIGKTTSIREFAKNYKCFIEINFYLQPKYKDIFSSYNANEIVKRISLLNPDIEIVEGDTLILFDEIQEYSDALTSFKSFYENKKFDVIASGSLLGIDYQNITSVPVGAKEEIEMTSLDFEEFLWAKGYKDAFIDELLEYLINLKPLPKLYLNLLNNLFNEYLIVGGLPEVVYKYCNSNNYNNMLKLQDEICLTYRNDIEKYVYSLDKSRVLFVFDSIIRQLAKDNHKFQYTMLGHGARYNQLYPCVQWIKDAGLISIVYNLKSLQIPLSFNKIDNNYRIYFSDTTLFLNKLDKEDRKNLIANQNYDIFNGAFYENIVCEALTKQGFELYFYKSEDATKELDFVIRVKNNIIPIEVKKYRGRSASLNYILENNNNINFGIKLTRSNINLDGKIITIPYCLSFLLKRFFDHSDIFNNY